MLADLSPSPSSRATSPKATGSAGVAAPIGAILRFT